MLQPRTEGLAARLFAWVNGGWSRHRRALDRRRLEHICRAHGTSRSIAIRIVRDYFAPEGKPDAE